MSDDEQTVPQQPAPDDMAARVIEALRAQALGALDYTLDEEGDAAVRKGVTRLHGAAAALRAVPLTNADEPGFIFRPYCAGG